MKMDASTSPDLQADLNVGQFYFHIQNSNFPQHLKHTSTVIKYTKLPEFDFDSKVIWPKKNTYILQPRLRRIISIDEDNLTKTSRSLRADFASASSNYMPTSCSRRKITTITEAMEARTSVITPKKKQEVRASQAKVTKSELKPEILKNKLLRPGPVRIKQDAKSCAKNVALSNNNIRSVSPTRSFTRTKSQHDSKYKQMQENKNSIIREREKSPRKNVNSKVSNKTYNGKKNVKRSASEKEIILLKSKLNDKNDEVSLLSLIPKLNEVGSKAKGPIIHVPIEKRNIFFIQNEIPKVDCCIGVDSKVCTKNVALETDPLPNKIDVVLEVNEDLLRKTELATKTDNDEKFYIRSDLESKTEVDEKIVGKPEFDTKEMGERILTQTNQLQRSCYIQTEFSFSENRACSFDDLEVPSVTLLKEKSDISKDTDLSQSLPHLQVPAMKITPRKEYRESTLEHHSRSTSFIVGRATVTYTTKQEFDFHMAKDQNEVSHNGSSSRLAYPMNVVSVLKKEVNEDCEETQDHLKESKESAQNKRGDTNSDLLNCLNEMKNLNCSYIFKSTKLVKPSKIISTISVNKGLLQSDFICEQFQRELNFIDSFFESLQYLESCSLSDKRVENIVSKSGLDIQNSEYGSFFSKFENGTNCDDTETMASKSLCLLNLLIRDEQRRAKNLLFVLKMREAALKDFTKSQILWLENKKKHDNTDIPTLKKKQRGALLKLQHECGEMQRMRKALLALSEKRKVALMKTKKNIELKLKNNVTVDPILLGKNKLKRSCSTDRCTVPLKCFDLSSSGCEESSTSRGKSEPIEAEVLPAAKTSSAEKCIQTGDGLLTASINQATDTSTENFLTVDGAYLNILFANLFLPEIFNSGKQYEVNEEALRSIVASTNSVQSATSKSDIIGKLVDQVYNRDQDISTTPSTARSLVEELDQYYKVLTEEEKLSVDSDKEDRKSVHTLMNEGNDSTETVKEKSEDESGSSGAVCDVEESKLVSVELTDEIGSGNSVTTQVMKGKEAASTGAQAGPLPVPAGEADPAADANALCLIPFNRSTSCTTFTTGSSTASVCLTSSVAALSGPSQNEAEELRRQQLAIEREIKALEQQQCQLVVVREIPDKPPPPYTPPADARAQKPAPRFVVDDSIEDKVQKNLSNSITVSIEPTNSFDVFLQDYCQESIAKFKEKVSEKPWDACNLLPQKPPLEDNKLVKKTTADIKDILSGVQPNTVSGVGARRSDHIDDILFSEWRRCEPEWTALHSDEALVKNQIFEAIFQKILSETIDEYKKTIVVPCTD